MNQIFPFGFPFPTAAYLSLYVVTLVAHVVFMNYVVAGSGLVAWDALRRIRASAGRPPSPAAGLVRDWLPFALGVAITAGVAPLLFVQVLYQQQFYTANLLLFLRWLAIIPVLVVGFYLVYLLKTAWLARRPSWQGAAVAVAALGCFVFTAWSWTENHLLSLDEPAWTGFYGSGAPAYHSPQLLPRLATWLLGSVPTLAVILGWQLRALRRREPAEVSGASERGLALLGLVGLALATVGGTLHYGVLPAPLRSQYFGALAGPYLWAAVAGMTLQGVAWAIQGKRGRLSRGWLLLASTGCGVALVGMAVVREAIRLASVDVTRLYPLHAKAADVGGFPVFVLFLVVNAGLVFWALRMVRRRGASIGPGTEK